MSVLGIELQRISLGALMIAMGMLVDNGIVVAEGMVIGVRRGLPAARAAVQSVERTQFALLGATVIGIAAFGPISLSNDNAGHFFSITVSGCCDLFVLKLDIGGDCGAFIRTVFTKVIVGPRSGCPIQRNIIHTLSESIEF